MVESVPSGDGLATSLRKACKTTLTVSGRDVRRRFIKYWECNTPHTVYPGYVASHFGRQLRDSQKPNIEVFPNEEEQLAK